jgi:ethanolamine utilization protein EutQ (cupin superfamily)
MPENNNIGKVRVLHEVDVPYSGLDGVPAMELARVVTEAATTDLGGGFVRFENAGQLADWTLKYDEVFYVIEGSFEVLSNGSSVVAGPGEVILIPKGTTVTYRGRANTKVFFVLHPRDWATRG